MPDPLRSAAAAPLRDEWLPPGTVLGEAFRVVRPLARGGMGAVYVAERVEDGTVCALKVLRVRPGRDADGAARRRFEREARMSERVRSPYVARVLAAGMDEASGAPWIASEFLSGENLGAVVDRAGALSPVEVMRIAAQLCAALGAAHAAGVVHRDLKPENVMLVPLEGPEPFMVKLLDFGIARGADGSAALPAARPRSSEDTTAPPPTTSAVGSPLWMAPELVNLLPADAGTDLWSLGLLVFWALTGKPYWCAANASTVRFDALLGEKLFGEMERGSARAARLGVADRWPAALDPWFARCVSRERSARYPDAAEAHRALHAALESVVPSTLPRALVAAAPPGDSPRVRRAVRRGRRRETAMAVGAGALVLSLGLALGAHGSRRATERVVASLPSPVDVAPSVGKSVEAVGTQPMRAVPVATSPIAPAPAPRSHSSTPASSTRRAPADQVAPAASADAGRAPYVPRVVPAAEVSAQWEPQLHEIQRGCWREAMARNGSHRAEAYHLNLHLDLEGRASEVRVEDMSDAVLAQCLRSRIAAHRFPPQPWAGQYGFSTGFPMP